MMHFFKKTIKKSSSMMKDFGEGVPIMIQILLVDEQRLFCEAVKAIIEEEKDMKVVGIATTEDEIVNCLETKEPDIILIDIHLFGACGFHVMPQLKETYPDLKVIYLASDVEKELLIGAMVAGANGFLDKALNSKRLIQAIRDAFDDQVVISGDAAQTLAEEIIELRYDRHDLLKNKLMSRDMELTDREIDVALLIMDQYTNKEIAEELFISEGTTKNYVSNIYDKINLRNRQHVISYLSGLLSQNDTQKNNVFV